MPKRSKWVNFGLAVTIIGAIAIVYSLFHATIFLGHDSEWIISDILFIAAIIWLPIAVLSIAFKIKEIRNIRAFEAVPQINILAKIAYKHIDNHYYYIGFECSNGDYKQFEVGYLLYSITFEKDTGTLTYKQNGNKIFFIDYHLFKQPHQVQKQI